MKAGAHLIVKTYSIVAMLTLALAAQGSVIFDWLTVGDAGNADDTTTENVTGNTYGAVNYTYRISSTEVSNDQYVEYLNKVAATDPNGVYTTDMDITRSGSSGSYSYAVNSGFESKAVNYVDFFRAMRFVNWLDNGQLTGVQDASTTEAGVYTIGTGLNETRSSTANYFLPSEDEWYKAAFYDPVNAGADALGTTDYWLYTTQNDGAPVNEAPPGGTNSANFGQLDTTVVGGYINTTSYYGGYDFGGNVWEWTEEALGLSRVLRGGSFESGSARLSSPSSRLAYTPANSATKSVGFRVASAYVVPEPGTLSLVVISGLLLMAMRKFRVIA